MSRRATRRIPRPSTERYLPDEGSRVIQSPETEASAVHRRLFTIDTHIDTPTAGLAKPGWDFGARHDFAADRTQCDLPRMREGIDALVFAVYVGQAARTPEGLALAHDIAVRCFDRTLAALREHAPTCALALTADDALQFKAEGKRAIFLSVENAYSIGRDLAHLEKFYRRGVRMLGLTHMLHNDVADSSTDPRPAEWGGLSPFGREFVAECNRLGIALDASHASDDVLRDLLEVSQTPIVLSHTDCRAVCDHPRNVGDDLLRALAAKGGVIQINALPISLVSAPRNRRTEATAEVLLRYADFPLTPEMTAACDRECDRVCLEYPNPSVTLDDFVRHIEHAVEVAGIDHVGIGCDFDGGGGTFAGLRDVSDYPNITRALLARGWSEANLAKLWGENTLRIFRAAEAAVS
jgi:membrane dipeptidase